jgi:hypothetical protein
MSRHLSAYGISSAHAPRCEGRYRLFCFVLAAMAGLDNYVKRWRTALHVTVSALIVAILGLAITPAAHAAAATATLSVTSTWQTGFIAHFTITNSSTVPLTDWKLEFGLPIGESVSHTWNSNLGESWNLLADTTSPEATDQPSLDAVGRRFSAAATGRVGLLCKSACFRHFGHVPAREG